MHRLLPALLATVGAALAAPALADASMVYGCFPNLCIANDDGTGSKQLTTDGEQQTRRYFFQSMQRDGKRVAYTVNQDRAEIMTVDSGVRQTLPVGQFITGLMLKPDGARVAVNESGGGESSPTTLCTYGVGTGDRECRGTGWLRFDWLGDDLVATRQADPGSVRAKLCVVAAPGGTGCARDVVNDPAHNVDDPAVSPDGKLVAVTWAENFNNSLGPIAIYSTETGQLVRQLTNGQQDDDAAWSADGQRIVFARDKQQTNFGLYSIPATGKPGDEKLVVAGGQNPTLGGPAGASGAAPVSKVSVKSSQKGPAVKGSANVGSDDSTFGVEAKADDGQLKSAKLVRVGIQKTKTVDAGTQKFTVKLTSKARAALTRRGKLKVTVYITVKPPGGKAAVVKKTVTLKP